MHLLVLVRWTSENRFVVEAAVNVIADFGGWWNGIDEAGGGRNHKVICRSERLLVEVEQRRLRPGLG